MINFNIDMIAIWAGVSTKPIDEWMKYTNGIENPRRKPPIVKDFGCPIDLDLFGIHISENDKIVPIKELIRGATIFSDITRQKIIEQAHILGVFEGNRLYSYNCSEFIPEYQNKKYNELTFIGNFRDDMP